MRTLRRLVAMSGMSFTHIALSVLLGALAIGFGVALIKQWFWFDDVLLLVGLPSCRRRSCFFFFCCRLTRRWCLAPAMFVAPDSLRIAADDEAEDDLEQRHAHVRPEDAGADGPDASLDHDLRCRKDVLRQVADDGHELPDREEDRQADDGRCDSLHAAPTSDASDHGRNSSAWTDASASRTSAATAAARGSAVTTTGRGRARSTSTTRSTRPGRGVMTTTRSARATASATLWVTKTTVRGRSSQRRWSSASNSSRVSASSALNGSSSSSTGGSPTNARASAARCAIPPESSRGRRPRGRGQTDLRERGFGAVAAHVRRDAGKLHRQRHVVDDRAPRHEARLLEVETDAPVAGDRLRPADQHPSGVGGLEPRDHPQERGLAAAVRSDHGGERAGIDRQVEPGQRLDLPAGRRETRVDTVERDVESGRGRVRRHRGSMTGAAIGHGASDRGCRERRHDVITPCRTRSALAFSHPDCDRRPCLPRRAPGVRSAASATDAVRGLAR